MRAAAAKTPPKPFDPKWLAALTAQAIAEGRHSETFRTYCEGCGREVNSIFHIGFDGKRFGRCCTPGEILKPAAPKQGARR